MNRRRFLLSSLVLMLGPIRFTPALAGQPEPTPAEPTLDPTVYASAKRSLQIPSFKGFMLWLVGIAAFDSERDAPRFFDSFVRITAADPEFEVVDTTQYGDRVQAGIKEAVIDYDPPLNDMSLITHGVFVLNGAIVSMGFATWEPNETDAILQDSLEFNLEWQTAIRDSGGPYTGKELLGMLPTETEVPHGVVIHENWDEIYDR